MSSSSNSGSYGSIALISSKDGGDDDMEETGGRQRS